MATIRMRATGTRTAFDALVSALHGLDGVERVEELADLMPHLDDDDSSSAGLVDDMAGGDVHALEIEAIPPHDAAVRDTADRIAADRGLVLEYVDDF